MEGARIVSHSTLLHLSEVIGLYKSHILSHIEYRTAAIYHAAASVLIELDSVQTRFLKDRGISELAAFLSFR